MSAFEDWHMNYKDHEYSVIEDMKSAFNAGMEHAAEILDSLPRSDMPTHYSSLQAYTIRKEIK